jgi:hypothetical protein
MATSESDERADGVVDLSDSSVAAAFGVKRA